MKIDKKIIEELVGYLKEFNLSEIEYSEGTTKVKVSRSINSSGVISAETADAVKASDADIVTVAVRRVNISDKNQPFHFII